MNDEKKSAETEYQFNSLDETTNQEEAETYYKERGWDILKPKLIKGKCNHKWVKIGERDYQCECGSGYIGTPKGV